MGSTPISPSQLHWVMQWVLGASGPAGGRFIPHYRQSDWLGDFKQSRLRGTAAYTRLVVYAAVFMT
jgi:hypothetical protein